LSDDRPDDGTKRYLERLREREQQAPLPDQRAEAEEYLKRKYDEWIRDHPPPPGTTGFDFGARESERLRQENQRHLENLPTPGERAQSQRLLVYAGIVVLLVAFVAGALGSDCGVHDLIYGH
jgi:hypothetical protein